MSLITGEPRVESDANVAGDLAIRSRKRKRKMDWGYKATLTAFAVATVLMTVRIFGRRAAGVLAGLPTISAPAFVWIAMDRGAEFASQTAVGGIAACGLFALFSVTYERLGRNAGPIVTLLASLGIVGALAALAPTLNQPLWLVLGAAVAACVLALSVLPNPSITSHVPKCRRFDIFLTAITAGIASAIVTANAEALGAFWCGIAASLPIISTSVVVHQHATASQHDVQRFLRGYVLGLIGKAFFAAAFSVAVLYCTVSVAMLAAFTCGALALLWTNQQLVRKQLVKARAEERLIGN
jgi:hypothetical protein